MLVNVVFLDFTYEVGKYDFEVIFDGGVGKKVAPSHRKYGIVIK